MDVVIDRQRDRRQQHRQLGEPGTAAAAPAAASSGRSTGPGRRTTTSTTTSASGCGPTPTTPTSSSTATTSRPTREASLRDQLQRRIRQHLRPQRPGRGPPNPGFPMPALYLSEAGGDSRAGQLGDTFEVAFNLFQDNWSAVMLWENADRFCGLAREHQHGRHHAGQPRDRDLDVRVGHGKRSRTSATAGGRPRTFTCTTTSSGSTRRTSAAAPRRVRYKGCLQLRHLPRLVALQGRRRAGQITFNQNNRWYSNRYAGPWRFQAHELGSPVSWDEWRAGPYQQDASSTLD